MEGLDPGSGVQQDSIVFHIGSGNHVVAATSIGRAGRSLLVIAIVNCPALLLPAYGSLPVRT